LPVRQAKQPHCRTPLPVLEEVARKQCGQRSSMGIAVLIGPPPRTLLALAARRLEQLAKEGLGCLDQLACRPSVDHVALLLE
jgi:hypothetical protein